MHRKYIDHDIKHLKKVRKKLDKLKDKDPKRYNVFEANYRYLHRRLMRL